MVDAVRRGVKVRLLYDHLGSRKYPGFRQMNKRMTTAGIEWYQMMPIHPLKGRWRRPDLRNHRKLLVVDGEVGFMGSQNMIDASYLARKNIPTSTERAAANSQQRSGPGDLVPSDTSTT
jgi:cardiolipin synthase